MSNTTPNIYSYWKYEILNKMGHYPFSYYSYTWTKTRQRPLILNGNTNIVIEGYPRSGNSFALEAFRMVQTRDVIVVSHSHAPAQVKQAVKLGLPTLILIRDPRDAVASMSIFYPDKSLKQALVHYSDFYSRIWAYRNSFLLGTFEQLNSDYGSLIKRINDRFGTNFDLFVNSPENVAKCFALIEDNLQKGTGKERVDETIVARPSPIRANMKEKLIKDLTQPGLAPFLNDAEQWYKTFLDFASQST